MAAAVGFVLFFIFIYFMARESEKEKITRELIEYFNLKMSELQSKLTEAKPMLAHTLSFQNLEKLLTGSCEVSKLTSVECHACHMPATFICESCGEYGCIRPKSDCWGSNFKSYKYGGESHNKCLSCGSKENTVYYRYEKTDIKFRSEIIEDIKSMPEYFRDFQVERFDNFVSLVKQELQNYCEILSDLNLAYENNTNDSELRHEVCSMLSENTITPDIAKLILSRSISLESVREITSPLLITKDTAEKINEKIISTPNINVQELAEEFDDPYSESLSFDPAIRDAVKFDRYLNCVMYLRDRRKLQVFAVLFSSTQNEVESMSLIDRALHVELVNLEKLLTISTLPELKFLLNLNDPDKVVEMFIKKYKHMRKLGKDAIQILKWYSEDLIVPELIDRYQELNRSEIESLLGDQTKHHQSQKLFASNVPFEQCSAIVNESPNQGMDIEHVKIMWGAPDNEKINQLKTKQTQELKWYDPNENKKIVLYSAKFDNGKLVKWSM
jgi:hypothetical protein